MPSRPSAVPTHPFLTRGRVVAVGAVIAVLMAMVCAVNASAATRFAAPGGTGADPCANPEQPCSLGVAASIFSAKTLQPGDEVVVAPGEYKGSAGDLDGFGSVTIPQGVSVHGAPGQPRPKIVLDNAGLPPFIPGLVSVAAEASLSDVEIVSDLVGANLDLRGGTADRVISRTSSKNGIACRLGLGIIRNSACLSTGAGGIGLGNRFETGTTFREATNFVRNVTAISTGPESAGVEFKAISGSKPSPIFTVDAKGLVARGTAVDVAAHGTAATLSQSAVIHLSIDHSDYKTVATSEDQPGTVVVTPAGSGTNIQADPLLDTDQVHQLAGSPTIDAGASDGSSGSSDVDGEQRPVGAAPDIGADEFGGVVVATKPTLMSVTCSPGEVSISRHELTTCRATVVGKGLVSGQVDFFSDNPTSKFSDEGHCQLDAAPNRASCSVTYKAENIGSGGVHTITTAYRPTSAHDPSSASTKLRAAGAVRYVAPFATGASPCATPATACPLSTGAAAGQGANPGDLVLLAPGFYSNLSPNSGIQEMTFAPGIRIQGEAGKPRPLIFFSGGLREGENIPFFRLAAGDTLAHLEISTEFGKTGLLVPKDAVAEDLIVKTQAAKAISCKQSGGVINQSVCLSSGRLAASLGSQIFSEGDAEFSAQANQVTAVATGPESFGVKYALENVTDGGLGILDVFSTGIIASGTGADVQAQAQNLFQNPQNPQNAEVNITLEHSDYARAETLTGEETHATVTAAGSGTNIVGKPNLAADNFHERNASPTINKGPSGLSGVDIDGQQRAIGASADIGADEHGDRTDSVMSCSPPFVVGGLVSCQLTLTDIDGGGAPFGEAGFTSDRDGGFNGSSPCVLTPTDDSHSSSCEFSYTPTEVGTHTISSSYPGDDSHDENVSATQIDVEVGSTTTLSCDPSKLNVGETSSCTALVEGSGANPVLPTGKVSFSSGLQGVFSPTECDLAPIAGEAAKASCQVSYTPEVAGTHRLTAIYGGDGTSAPGVATADLQVDALEPVRDGTETNLACEPSPVLVGNPSTCVATVEDLDHPEKIPTGEVSFEHTEEGELLASSCTLAPAQSGGANCSVDYKPIAVGSGVHGISGDYGGAAEFLPSQGETTVSVITEGGGEVEDPTTTTLACDPTEVAVGFPSICTATVEDNAEVLSFPGGEVKFDSDREGDFADAAACVLKPTKAEGIASCQIAYTPSETGSHGIVAAYQGEPTHGQSEGSATIEVVAERHPSATVVSCDPNAVSPPESTICTATVTDTSAPLRAPTGKVDFSVAFDPTTGSGGFELPNHSGSAQASCELVANGNGQSSCAVKYIPDGPISAGAGIHTITGAYAGDSIHQPSQGSDQLLVSNETTTSLSCDPAAIRNGEQSTCTVTVTDSTEEATAPNGQVKFDTDAAGEFSGAGVCTLGNIGGAAASCQVTYTPTAVGSGSHRITATYQGELEHRPSQASALITVTQNQEEEEGEAGKNPTSTTVDCEPELVEVTTATHCAIAVTDLGANPTPPTGKVALSSNGAGVFAPATECALAPGQAAGVSTCQVDYTPTEIGTGSQVITARYPNDATHKRSEGTDPISITTFTGGAVENPTATELTCDPGQVEVNSASTCTATVTDIADEGATVPTGQIKLSSNAAGDFAGGGICDLAQSGANEASCQLDYTPTAVGAHQITADYSGDDGHLISQGIDLDTQRDRRTGPHRQPGATTSTTLTCDPDAVATSQASTCTATVTDTAATGAVNPSGRVEFSSDGIALLRRRADLPAEPPGRPHRGELPDHLRPGHRRLRHPQSDRRLPPGRPSASQGSDDVAVTLEDPVLDQTTTTLVCTPDAVNTSEPSNCVATVRDDEDPATTPSGRVEFDSNAVGAFSDAATCILSKIAAGEEEPARSTTPRSSPTPPPTKSSPPTRATPATASARAPMTSANTPEDPEPNEDQTAVKCDPASLEAGKATSCLATVTDVSPNPSQPNGEVSFDSNRDGAFNPASAP